MTICQTKSYFLISVESSNSVLPSLAINRSAYRAMMGKAFEKRCKVGYVHVDTCISTNSLCIHLSRLRSQEADIRREDKLTCFSLPLVKHGDIEVRILFHFSSFAAKAEFSRGPENISCQHQEGWVQRMSTTFSHLYENLGQRSDSESV